MNERPMRHHARSLAATLLIVAAMAATASLPAGFGGASIVKAADPSADIPGVDLPGPIVAGRLGGAIYDVVYRLTIAPGYVIVASLTGAPGSDFDLYLFDASATTVLSDTGLLRKSIGSTSTESLSWPSSLGGTYYIDLNGATDVEGDYRLTVQTIPDSTPPTLSMVLAGGKGSTNQSVVPVSLTAADDLSGVTEMALSADGVTYRPWEPFRTTTSWAFDPGDGPKVLWAKVRNGVGLESLPATASTTIDTVAPSVIDLSPAPGSSVVGLRPTFIVTFNEPMDAGSWNDLGLIVQSATGALVQGAYTFDASRRTGAFVPGTPLQAGATYVVTFGDVRDIAGNRVSIEGSWSVTPLAPTTLTAKADHNIIVSGGASRIDVSLVGVPSPATIGVLSSAAQGGYLPLTVLQTEHGVASLVVIPAVNTTYRFSYIGGAGAAPSQVDVPILVRRAVALTGQTSGIITKARVGVPVRLQASVGPIDVVSVSFRLYRFDSTRRRWAFAGSHGRSTDSLGRASYSWTPTTPGSYYWRAGVSSTVEFANNVSPVYRWSVSR